MSQETTEYEKAWQEEMAEVKAELEELRAQKAAMERQVEDERLDRAIRDGLASEEVVDAEAAAALVRQRMEAGGETDPAEVIGRLAKEKPHLFGKRGGSLPPRTRGVRQRPGEDQSPLHAAAQRAADSGTARDVVAYLRIRRQHQ